MPRGTFGEKVWKTCNWEILQDFEEIISNFVDKISGGLVKTAFHAYAGTICEKKSGNFLNFSNFQRLLSVKFSIFLGKNLHEFLQVSLTEIGQALFFTGQKNVWGNSRKNVNVYFCRTSGRQIQTLCRKTSVWFVKIDFHVSEGKIYEKRFWEVFEIFYFSSDFEERKFFFQS